MLKIYNTASQKKEVFKPIEKNKVRMYTCGPTVYDYAHIGNFRAYIISDIIRRYLESKKYKVKKIVNLTDVGHFTNDDSQTGEDKILLASKKERKTPEEVAEYYINAFFEDEKKLNIKESNVYPKATDYIKEMQKIVKTLLHKGYAYKIEDGIYFNVPKFKSYGKLSGNTLEKLKEGARIEPNPKKKHPADFALWIKAKPNDLMKWNSPWGKGFPGWHIECSAMSTKNLGESIDIHTGGEDNKFPHHENEIAQSESFSNKPFSKYWLHVRHLLVNGEKMAKSKGNFYTIKDIEKKGFSPLSFRLLVLNNHYRKQLNFTIRGLKQAESNLKRTEEFVERLKELSKKRITKRKLPKRKSFDSGTNPDSLILKTKADFEKSMNNDFNTPSGLAAIFHLINRGNWLLDKEKLTSKEAKKILKTLKEFDQVVGFIFNEKEEIPEKVISLAEERKKLREEKRWEEADKKRKEIESLGYSIKDVKKEYSIKKI